MTRYGRSPWLERYPRARVPSYPAIRSAMTTDVLVIGGGLTGCAAAYAFAAAGVKVILIEAGHVGRGSSAAAFGWIADTPAASFRECEEMAGLRSARRVWQAWRRAALDFAALLRRLDVTCALESTQTLQLARTDDQAATLARDLKARRAAGLDGVMAPPRSIAADFGGNATAAIRTRDGATLDPYRAALGLAAAAHARGAAVFERSPVTRLRSGARQVEAVTAHAVVTAYRVIIATGEPTALVPSLARHVRPQQTHFALTEPVPAKVRRTLGSSTTVTRDAGTPPHHIRWVGDDRLLVSGADGARVPTRGRDKHLVQRTGQLMYELSTLYPDISGLAPAFGWDAAYGRTADALPYIGPHRNLPRHLFAFGGSGHSVTEAYLASRILLRHYLGETDAVDEVFGFTRA